MRGRLNNAAAAAAAAGLGTAANLPWSAVARSRSGSRSFQTGCSAVPALQPSTQKVPPPWQGRYGEVTAF
jgi:hypothetical protein